MQLLKTARWGRKKLWPVGVKAGTRMTRLATLLALRDCDPFSSGELMMSKSSRRV